MIKAIITDLDNSLLRTDKSISAYTADVLTRCRARGLRVACATARPMRALAELGLSGYLDGMVCMNGGLVHTDGQTLAQCTIAPEEAHTLLNLAMASRPDVRACAEAGDILYSNTDITDLWRGCPFALTRFASPVPKAPHKLIFVGLGADAAALLADALSAHLYIEVDRNGYVFVMPRQASKPRGIEVLAAHWGLKLRDVVAFGDDINDVAMLRECGLGVAMANAVPEAKAAAGAHCGHCDEDGVARWLEEKLL